MVGDKYACYHGGASIKELGDSFDNLQRSMEVINADVLDAWFPPAPRALALIQGNLPMLARTSPPAAADGLLAAIAKARALDTENIAIGAGSSDLIYRCFLTWLHSNSKVLLLEPTYGEYAHVLEQVIGCQVDRLQLQPQHDYQLDIAAYKAALQLQYDLVIVVNPNNPTGSFISRQRWQQMLELTPPSTRVWVDECYIDYVDRHASLESLVRQYANLVICKSLSKILALSGMRVAYMCADAALIGEIKRRTPPWVVNLPGQIAAIKALQETDYYTECYAITQIQHTVVETKLREYGFKVISGVANFCMLQLEGGVTAARFVAACQQQGLYLRDLYPTSPSLGRYALRLAIKDANSNQRILQIMQQVAKAQAAVLGGL